MSKIRKAAATLMLMSSVNTVGLGDFLCCFHRKEPQAERVEETKIEVFRRTRYTAVEVRHLVNGKEEKKEVTLFPTMASVPINHARLPMRFPQTSEHDDCEYRIEVMLSEEPTIGKPLEIMVITDKAVFEGNIEVTRGKEYIAYSHGQWRNSISGTSQPWYDVFGERLKFSLLYGRGMPELVAKASNGFRVEPENAVIPAPEQNTD